VPLLALAGPLWLACAFVIGERFGKAVRSPARDTMLAAASAKLGAGRTFALHEALDQSGALVGPLVVAAMLATHHGYKAGFAILAVPGVLAMLVLFYLRRQVPTPATFAVLAYHLQRRHVVSPAAQIPVMYAVAMGLAALGSLASGRVYDRTGYAACSCFLCSAPWCRSSPSPLVSRWSGSAPRYGAR